MVKVLVLIANGSEEVETLFPVDVLRRASVLVDLTSINEKTVLCSRNVSVVADKLFSEIDVSEYDAVVIPGGLNGAKNLSKDERVIKAVEEMINSNKLVCAICAAPALVLAKHGLIKGKKATCFPDEEFISLIGENYTGENVTVDGTLITANGPKSALDFSLAICKALNVTPRI